MIVVGTSDEQTAQPPESRVSVFAAENIDDYVPALFLPDAERFITSYPGPQIWSSKTLLRQKTVGNEHAKRERLAVSRDGRWLAAGSLTEKMIELWDLNDESAQTPLWRIPNHSVSDLAFSPNGESIALVDWGADRVTLLDRKTGKTIKMLQALQCHRASFSRNGRHLAVDELDDIVIWDTSTWEPITRLKGHLSTIRALTFDASGRYLASGGHDREIRIWDAVTWKVLHTMHGHRSEVSNICFSSNSRLALSVDSGSYVKIWDLSTGLEVGNLHVPSDGEVGQIALSPDNRQLIIRLKNGHIVRQPL